MSCTNRAPNYSAWQWLAPRRVLMVLMLFLVTPAWASSGIAMIDTFTCSASDFVLSRNGQKKPVIIYGKLQSGDKITVKNRKSGRLKCSITLLLGNNDSVTVKHKALLSRDNKHVILRYKNTVRASYKTKKVRHGSGSVSGGFFEKASNWLTSWWKSPKENKVFASVRSDGVPTIPLLETGEDKAKIRAGKKTLYLAWQGENAKKYIVTVQRLGKRTTETLFQKTIAGMTAKASLKKSLRQGDKCEISVISKNDGLKTTKEFKVVDSEADNLQKKPKHLQVKEALFLAKDVEWKFEAYQQLARLKGYKPAEEVKKAFEQGHKSPF